MRTELRYLSAMTRAYVAGDGGAPPVDESVDWSFLVGLIETHHLATALLPQVAAGGAPGPALATLAASARTARLKNGILVLELLRLLPVLEKSGANPLVLKGVGLSHTVYPNPNDRVFGDLDLLVERQAIDRASADLERLGYRPAHTVQDPLFYEKHHFHRILRGAAGVTLELHWDLTRTRDYCRFDLQGFRDRSRPLTLDGAQVQIPADADQLLHAASQALSEGFSDMRRVIDAALLLQAGCSEDAALVERARAQGLATALWITLGLARDLVGGAVPSSMDRELAPSAPVRACIESLGLPSKTLLALIAKRTEIKHLLRWLCAPDAASVVREVGRFLLPGEEQMLSDGHAPGQFPGPAARVVHSIERGGALVKLAAYQAWRLAAIHREDR